VPAPPIARLPILRSLVKLSLWTIPLCMATQTTPATTPHGHTTAGAAPVMMASRSTSGSELSCIFLVYSYDAPVFQSSNRRVRNIESQIGTGRSGGPSSSAATIRRTRRRQASVSTTYVV
jgi:hypothetical protein